MRRAREQGSGSHNPKHAQNRPATGGPIRSCVACGRAFAVSKGQARTAAAFQARASEGSLQVLHVCTQRQCEAPSVILDVGAGTAGRGAWICATSTCIERAWQRKSIQRALKGAMPDEELKQQLLGACVE